ncbi:DUF6134 family protein [Cognatitamlana onchidii]|uniref:DUF6134 family protein n=1 Tax=Cognatitamlana onchidii TaxID=2562860 RepID=UPI0014561414|nr:DUF6134 family protein [Algibacter onchidii]
MRVVVNIMSFLFVLFIQAQSEHHLFNVIYQDKLLGTLEATKVTKGNVINYKSHTNIEYSFLINFSISYKYDVLYVDGILKDANAHITVRGKDKTKVRTILEEGVYNFYSNEKLSKTIETDIKNSVIQLVFQEPVAVKTVYAEEHAEFHQMEKISEHAYKKKSHTGKESYYYYQQGILQKSEVDAGIIRFSIVRVD